MVPLAGAVRGQKCVAVGGDLVDKVQETVLQSRQSLASGATAWAGVRALRIRLPFLFARSGTVSRRVSDG